MYKRLTKDRFENLHGYQILPLREEDIESIRVWRNAQMDVLRQNVLIGVEEQRAYFQQKIVPTFDQQNPSQLLFSFLLHEQCIGYGGLTYLDWNSQRAEVSFLVNPLRAQQVNIYREDCMNFLDLLCQVAFDHLCLHRLMTETFAFREETKQILEKFGFKFEGMLREHVYKRHQWVDSVMHGLLAKEWNAKQHTYHEYF